MKGKLNVLMAFSEVAPFAKTGGMGDVGGALPKVLKEMGHDVRIITPQYRMINERRYILRDVIRLQNIDVLSGGKTLKINVKSAFLPNSKVQVYFLDYKPFFSRDGLYSDKKSRKEYPDNDKRFILFSKGILETLKKLQWQPDVIHCNGWQTSLVPFFLKTVYRNDIFFNNTSSLVTVHNFYFQGNFDPTCLTYMDIDTDFSFTESDIGINEQFSFLKAGIIYSDMVNTVSETYAEEVKSFSDYSFGMGDVLRKYDKDFCGVLNGADYSVWDPNVDSRIPEKYNINNLDIKRENKRILLEKYGLPFFEKRPVVAMISRLTDQKGLDLVCDAFNEIMDLDINFLLLGIGDKLYHQFFEKVKNKYVDRVGISLTFDDSLAHLIQAGADILLMPSKYEPCGLTQLYSLKYGTVPVVRSTGGLVETIKPFDPDTGKGTGFLFNDLNTKDLMRAIKQTVRIFKDQKTWLRIMKNGMREDYSWRLSAKKYVQLYGKCISKNK